MSVRCRLARFLLRLSSLLQSLPVVVMKPDDLVDFGRRSYARPQTVDSWMEDELVDSGLSEEEDRLLSDTPRKQGDLLLLGLGGGREAIALARRGFRVTGVDYLEEMVRGAMTNARSRDMKIEGLVQEISRLDAGDERFDVVWLSRAMYSSVPTRRRRLEMLRRIARSLRPRGILICQFMWLDGVHQSSRIERIRRFLAATGLFNGAYETGDSLWLNVEFLHLFPSRELLLSELQEGGFDVEKIHMDFPGNRGGAICRKKSHRDRENTDGVEEECQR